MIIRLSYDILVQILSCFHDDYLSLYHCTLVDREFNNAATRTIYRRIWYSPVRQHILNLKERGLLEENLLLKSACLPHNAPFVIELEVTGFISTRTPPLFNLCTTIAAAIPKFINLSKITFCPATFHEDLFAKSLGLLPGLDYLRELIVNTSCTSERTIPLLTQVKGLRKLTLHSPGRAILDVLPAWLEGLSPGLSGLHLKENCGSITPGVLKSFIPHISENLRELTLGLSYSLTDEDVFSFLAQLPLLERLQLQYYLQLRSPKITPRLARLKYLAVNYAPVSVRSEVIALCKWIKRLIAFSPIEHVRLLREDLGPDTAHIPFDSVLDHLVMKHAATLCILDLMHTYVTADGVRSILERCVYLEEMYVAVRKQVLDVFREHAGRLSRLHTAGFNIRNAKMKRALVDDGLARKIITEGPPSFRRLAVNGAAWEGAWISQYDDGSVYFVVQRIRGSCQPG